MSIRGKSITLTYRAWDSVANAPKAGDVANHSTVWVLNGVGAATTNTPTACTGASAAGFYKVTLTATEANCDVGQLTGTSSTTGVYLFGPTIAFETNGVVTAGTAQAAAAGTLTLASGDGANCSVGQLVLVQSASAGAGQSRRIVKIATDTVTLDLPWDTTPSGTITYIVFAIPKSRVQITVQADGGNSASQFKSDRTETGTDYWKNTYILATSGNLVGEVQKCTAYDGSTKIFTVNSFSATWSTGDTADIVNF